MSHKAEYNQAWARRQGSHQYASWENKEEREAKFCEGGVPSGGRSMI
jgi:hypothetical protein